MTAGKGDIMMDELDLADEILDEEDVTIPVKDQTPSENKIYSTIITALAALETDRANDHDAWVAVGMCIHSALPDALALWDTWSKCSTKYEPGKCAEKWTEFKDSDTLNLSTLLKWAEEDSGGNFIRLCPKNAKPSAYMRALHAMGYNFTMNAMNDRIYINHNLLSSGMVSVLFTRLREYNYKATNVAEQAWIAEGYQNQFHPIRDYLTKLEWDGTDHISLLAGYFKDKDGIFPLLLRKWLIGAVGKIIGKREGDQNPMLVLDGKQGVGKSRFVWWLGSVLPEFYKQSAIDPEDKDYFIDAIGHFVWEVEELGSTIRKADREALKAFVSKERVTVRVPYGHYEIKKPVTSSYIGTLNNEGGFLSDPTGNRRFRVCTITSIDWAYSTNISVNQVWAQAVALVNAGETQLLDAQGEAQVTEINTRYEIEDILQYHILHYFQIEQRQQDWYLQTAQIVTMLEMYSVPLKGTDAQIGQRIAAVLIRAGLEKKKRTIGKNRPWVWIGIRINPKNSELDLI